MNTKRMLLLCFFSFVVMAPFTDAKAVLLDLDRILGGDTEYIDSVRPLIKNLREIQIGGTHTYGNKTVIKKDGVPTDQLNPSILIINPDETAHNKEDPTVISIQGSGFDRAIVKKLSSVLGFFHHQVKRIYINNLGFILGIPDSLPNSISEAQSESIGRGSLSFLILSDSRLIQSFGQYLLYNDNDPRRYDLYSYYFQLLELGGEFLFKSASIPDAGSVFNYSFLSPRNGLRILDEKWIHGSDRVLRYAVASERIHRGDKNLSDRMVEKLGTLGSFFSFESIDYDADVAQGASALLASNDPHLNIRLQVYLLKLTGFTDVGVQIGRFKDWGFNQGGVNGETFSLVIRAKKTHKSNPYRREIPSAEHIGFEGVTLPSAAQILDIPVGTGGRLILETESGEVLNGEARVFQVMISSCVEKRLKVPFHFLEILRDHSRAQVWFELAVQSSWSAGTFQVKQRYRLERAKALENVVTAGSEGDLFIRFGIEFFDRFQVVNQTPVDSQASLVPKD